MEELRVHQVQLTTPRLRLRPMSEQDWPTLLRWNQDPGVLLYWNDGDTAPWTLEDLQRIYRRISQDAHMFVVEEAGRPIGECWLQRMNLDQVIRALPGRRLFRIDLSIGEPGRWGQGFGTEVVRALSEFGFRSEGADAIFACHVATTNPASRRAFEKVGFVLWGSPMASDRGGRASVRQHLILNREGWEAASGRPGIRSTADGWGLGTDVPRR